MKKRWLAFVMVFMVTALLFSACGKKGNEQSDNIKMADIEKLLSNDYEAEYIYRMAGLSVDGSKKLTTADGEIYYSVQSDKYKTVSDLDKLLAETYSDEETIAMYRETVDLKGHALYIDIDGKLCRSSEPLVGEFSPEADYESISKGKSEKGENGRPKTTFTISEHGTDGGEYRAVIGAEQGKDGKWRLTTARADATREVIKQGGGASEVVAGSVRAIADSFVKAISEGDTASVEKLTQAANGSYGYFAQAGVKSASCTTVSESDYDGEYLVELTVSGGNGTFMEGKNSYRMKVGYSDNDGALVVRYLQPADFVPYDRLPTEKRTAVAANQVTYLMQLAGNIQFASPSAIPPETITEYVLWMAEMKDGPNENGMALAELSAQVKKYFGIDSFDPTTKSNFYNADTDSFFLLGRGLPSFNMFVVPVSDGNGVAVVEVTDFDLVSDPLMLKPLSTTVYKLNNNWNETYTFSSGIKK